MAPEVVELPAVRPRRHLDGGQEGVNLGASGAGGDGERPAPPRAPVGRGRRALQEFVLTGPKTTIPFHRALLEEPDFINGRISTSFIQDHPSLLDKTKAFEQEISPFESLYGSGEVAAAIAAGVVISSDT